MAHSPEVLAEIEKNEEFYATVQSDMEANHWGRTVLLHNGEVVAIYNDRGDAYQIGCEKFGPGGFSLHLVGRRPVNLGFHSFALKKAE